MSMDDNLQDINSYDYKKNIPGTIPYKINRFLAKKYGDLLGSVIVITACALIAFLIFMLPEGPWYFFGVVFMLIGFVFLPVFIGLAFRSLIHRDKAGTLSPIGQILRLCCIKCNSNYAIGEDAIIVTMDMTKALLDNTVVIRSEGSSTNVKKDIISLVTNVPADRRSTILKQAVETSKSVLESLKTDQKRIWICYKCKNENNYSPLVTPISAPSSQTLSIKKSENLNLKVSNEIPKDPVISMHEAMMNGMANALGYEQKGNINFIVQNNRIIGIWVSAFPGNTTKKAFLQMYCTMKSQKMSKDVGYNGIDEAINAVLTDAYRITRSDKGGFNIYFL
jgi:hypothetical protein